MMATDGWCAPRYLPEREIMTGIGAVAVRRPWVRVPPAGGKRIRFSSAIIAAEKSWNRLRGHAGCRKSILLDAPIVASHPALGYHSR
jgi:hypothetical protein